METGRPFDDPEGEEGDRALVTRAQAGDRRALEELAARHQAWIYNIAIRMLGHPQDAEDATQEILIKALTRLSSFEGRSRFLPRRLGRMDRRGRRPLDPGHRLHVSAAPRLWTRAYPERPRVRLPDPWPGEHAGPLSSGMADRSDRTGDALRGGWSPRRLGGGDVIPSRRRGWACRCSFSRPSSAG